MGGERIYCGYAQIKREMCIRFAQLYMYLRNVTDRVKINEQNKPIATGPFYVRTEFEAIWALLPEDVVVLNPVGYWAS